MIIFFKTLKILFFIFKYRLFFLIGFIPYLGIFKLLLKPNCKNQANRFKRFLENIGPCFIKFGQILSVRGDLVGDTFANALASLREDGKQANKKLITKAIVEAFGSNYYQIIVQKFNHKKESTSNEAAFKEDVTNFSQEKLLNNLQLVAVGSVAEVYKLNIASNTLAVKVLKPGIREKFQQDIAFLRKIFAFFERNIQEANRTKVLKVIDLLERISNFELDLKFEAAAAAEMNDNFKELKVLHIPKIYWDFCTKDVLVTNWVDGYKIYNKDQLEANNINKTQVLKNLLTVFFLQVLKFGFLHGDLHPGNIIIKKDGTLTLVDFGIMGRIPLSIRKYIYDVWKAFLNQDYKEAAKAHFKAGWVSSNYNEDDMALAVRAIIDPVFLKDKNNLSIGKLMEQLFEITKIFGMEIQRELLLVQKSMLLLEGMARDLSKEDNIWLLAKEIINTEDFKISLADKVMYTKSYFSDSLQENLNKVAEIFANANHKVNLTNKVVTKIKLPLFNYFIIVLMVIIIFELLWKI